MDDLDKFILDAKLKDGWRATGIHEIQRDQPNRCRTYLASNSARELGFVKVLPPSTDDLDQMRLHLEEFFSEKEIVELCGKRNMQRIVRAIAFDKLEAPGIVPITIHYLIFEWAPRDMRALMTDTDDDQVVAALACLHHMATALHELHFSKIAHQNLRPAAVLRFDDATHKLSDFRHAQRAGALRTDTASFIDAAHAPPELLYGHPTLAFEARFGGDVYQLGALGLHLLTGIGATVQLARGLSDFHHWRNWEGSFADVLPYLNIVHERMIENLHNLLPASIQNELTEAIRQLTMPDPARRGHPTHIDGSGPRYGLERFISLFDLLGQRFRIAARGAA
jgi:eukaryotic-like serine/threonine-protein kinase